MLQEQDFKLIKSGKYTIEFELFGKTYTKRFSGNWSAKKHFKYIQDNFNSEEETLKYIEGFFSPFKEIEISDYNSFAREKIVDFKIQDKIIKIQDSITFDYYDYSDLSKLEVDINEAIENGYISNGSCDGDYYLYKLKEIKIIKEHELYFETDKELYFKGLSKNENKYLFKKDNAFLEELSLTPEYFQKIQNVWNN